MNQEFEEHERPRPSRLETWRSEITAMRAAKWPCMKIARWLLENHKFQISAEAVRQFCKVRSIQKGQSKTAPQTRSQRHQQSVKPKDNSKPAKLFEYDDSKPIQIRRT